jgi:hypothetical protein
VRTSSLILSCPLCSHSFSHEIPNEAPDQSVFGYGLDYRLLPMDSGLHSEIATCPNCLFTAIPKDFESPVSGQVKSLIGSKEYTGIFEPRSSEESIVRGWLAMTAILDAKKSSPRDLGLLCLRGSWLAREVGCLESEAELLDSADAFLEDSLRRGLTKGDPGYVIYLLGEINRRRGCFMRAKEMLTFLGNNPRYRYPALLLTVLIEEEDPTPYWSLHAPDEMESRSSTFKGLFPALRSIPPGKLEFSKTELSDHAESSDEDDGRRF